MWYHLAKAPTSHHDDGHLLTMLARLSLAFAAISVVSAASSTQLVGCTTAAQIEYLQGATSGTAADASGCAVSCPYHLILDETKAPQLTSRPLAKSWTSGTRCTRPKTSLAIARLT